MPKDKRYNCIPLDYDNSIKQPTRSIQKEAAIQKLQEKKMSLSDDALQRIKRNKEAALLKREEKKQKSEQKPQEDCEIEAEVLHDFDIQVLEDQFMEDWEAAAEVMMEDYGCLAQSCAKTKELRVPVNQIHICYRALCCFLG